MTTGDKDDLFDFDFTGESMEYIGLMRARILAIQHARNEPGNYGDGFDDKGVVYELADSDEDDDYYHIRLSFRPVGNFEGTPGLEEFYVSKIGEVELRQVLSYPVVAETSHNVKTIDTEKISESVPSSSLTDRVTVTLLDYGKKKINVIKEVKSDMSLGLREAKNLVESAPIILKENISRAEAQSIQRKLEEKGAVVEIELYSSEKPAPITPDPDIQNIGENETAKNLAPSSPEYTSTSIHERSQELKVEKSVQLPDIVYQLPSHNVLEVVDKMLTGEICTIAGNGKKGFSGDGTFSLNATLNEPYDVAIDDDGNLYIADSGNHRVRKIDVQTGLMTTVVGDGDKGFKGDGGDPIQASLNQPRGIDFDAEGNLYFSDRSNHRIRKVSYSTGVIETIAGNGSSGHTGDAQPAVRGTLTNPESISISKESGKLFIACLSATGGAKRIRAVNRDGIMVTYAGCDKGNKPQDGGFATNVEFDRNNDLIVIAISDEVTFIGDQFKNLLYSVDNESRLLNVVAGTGSTGKRDDSSPLECNLAPQGLASQPGDINSIFINDGGSSGFGNKVFRKFDLDRNYIYTVAGNGKRGFDGDGGPAIEARFDKPRGMAVDSHGNLYIADTNNHRIRVVKGPL